MPPAGLEPTFPANERRQTHALDRAATGIGNQLAMERVLLWPAEGPACEDKPLFETFFKRDI
jgi:hypothetical protein